MGDFYRQLQSIIAAHETVAVATVIRRAGSVPQEVGARMIIHPEGRHRGTIGGGCGEAEVIRRALDAIDAGQPAVIRVDLTGDIALESDGICGGIMDVLIEPWPPAGEGAEWAGHLHALAQKESSNSPASYLRTLPPHAAQRVVLREDGSTLGEIPSEIAGRVAHMVADRQSGVITAEDELGLQWFLEVQRASPTLLIVGAGHIALPLASMAALLEFRVAVLDDRPAFVNAARFPDADQLIVEHFEKGLREFPIGSDTYIVLITRGHQHDVTCLLTVIDSPAAYIGMIGSRRRIAGVFDLLEREEGISREKLSRVHSPIGLAIGAVTPAEIAVSILAEIIKVYRRGQAASLSDRPCSRPGHPAVHSGGKHAERR